ncbi:MAG: hypothetical protein WC052_00530 [Patescibacteria group bacterium]
MTRRTKIIIGVGFLLGVGVLLYFLFQSRQTPPEVTPPPAKPAVENRDDGTAQVIGGVEPTPESTALRTARFVAERYGTFSSDEGLNGVQELVAVSTPQTTEWLTGIYIPQVTSRMKTSVFYAESARVLAATIITINDTTAGVHIRLQRQITEGSEERMNNAELDIELTRSGNTWLVSGIFEDR